MNRILVYRSLVIVFFLSSIFSGELGAISNQTKSENAAVEVDGGILVTLPKNEYNVNAQITRLEKDGLSLFFVRPSGDDCLPTDKKNKFSISYGNSCKMYARWTKEHFFLWLKNQED
uniref:Uncharacterized protein n=1 Tax=Ditylenchus dipsaci TaxID=166011 RepID=A0A915CUA7_9BILA